VIHLVYPHRRPPAAPDCIGFELSRGLTAAGYSVELHDIDEPRRIRARPGDVLIGHPGIVPFSCFRLSIDDPTWKRRLLMCPFNGRFEDVAFLAPLVRRCDQFLAITGSYWFEHSKTSDFRAWSPKMVHLDLGVNLQDFPRLNRQFNAPGERRFVYIGNDQAPKNTPYLAELARRMPETRIAWFGAAQKPLPGLESRGWVNFSHPQGRKLLAEFDFMLTVGNFDANPTTILEAMAWGLIPVCSPQSGYHHMPGVVNVPLDDPETAVAILRSLQHLDETTLRRWQAANQRALEDHFNWPRFVRQVIGAIESDARPPLGDESFQWQARLRVGEYLGPKSWLHPRNLAQNLRGHVGRWVRRALR
jgi:hypothetical protein